MNVEINQTDQVQIIKELRSNEFQAGEDLIMQSVLLIFPSTIILTINNIQSNVNKTKTVFSRAAWTWILGFGFALI